MLVHTRWLHGKIVLNMEFIAKDQFLGCFTSTLIAFDDLRWRLALHLLWRKGAKTPATTVPERNHQATMLSCGHFKTRVVDMTGFTIVSKAFSEWWKSGMNVSLMVHAAIPKMD